MDAKHLFKYISKQDLEEMLRSFHTVTNLNVVLLSDMGKEIITCGEKYDFCRKYVQFMKSPKRCAQEHVRAGQMSRDFGASYIFSCHSGLNHIVYPIMIKGLQFGSVHAGPFFMEEADASYFEDLPAAGDLSEKNREELFQSANAIPVITPEMAEQISVLFRYLFRSVLVESRGIIAANNEKLLQQSKINESIQLYKSSGARDDRNYPIELENELISSIKANNPEKAREILNALLGHIMLYTGHEISHVKYRIVELCSLLSRASISRGADPNLLLELNGKLVSSVMNARSIYDVCYSLQNNIDIFTDSLFQSSEHNSRVVKNAVAYIARHFSEEISLAKVSEELHVNPSYLSMLFKQVTGVTFKEHLNRIRIEEAERLLTNTDYPILEIAIACGYRDQSYFTKVFKKYTGLTPRQYR